MAKVKVKLQKMCATGADVRAPVMESLRAVRRQSLSAKTFYWLNKLSAVLEKEFTDYEAARIDLVMRLGTKIEGGGYAVPPEKNDEFQKEMASLNLEIELPLDDTVKLALPASGVAEDWFALMAELDIFAEPPA